MISVVVTQSSIWKTGTQLINKLGPSRISCKCWFSRVKLPQIWFTYNCWVPWTSKHIKHTILGAPKAIFTTGTQLNTLCSNNLTLFFLISLSCLEGYWPFILHPTQKNHGIPHILHISSPQWFYKLPITSTTTRRPFGKATLTADILQFFWINMKRLRVV